MRNRPTDEPVRGESLQDALARSTWVDELALSLVGDPALAADLSQEVRLAALEAGRNAPRRLRPWLAGAARKLALRWKRDDGRRAWNLRANTTAEELPSTDELVARSELRRIVAEEAERLDEPYRTTVFLRYFEGLRADEIARRQSVQASTVRSRLTRGLHVLGERMDQRYGERGGAWCVIAAGLSRSALPPLAVGAGTGTAWMQGVLAMKALQLGAAGAVVALAWGAWMLGREGEESSLAPAGAEAEADAPDAIADGAASVRAAEGGAASRDEVATTALETPEESGAHIPTSTVAPRTATVAVQVVDQAGYGIVGATLRWGPAAVSDRRFVSWGADTVRAGAGGRVRFEVEWLPREPLIDFEIRAPGYATGHARATFTERDEVELGRIVLQAGANARGMVVTDAGVPLQDATVFVTPPEGGWDASERTRRQGPVLETAVSWTRSSNDGSFVLDGVPSGYLRLWAHAEGYGYTHTEPLEGALLEGVELVLSPLRQVDSISGVVLSPEGVPMVASLLYDWRFGDRATSTSLVTEEDGSFELVLDHRVPVNFRAIDPEGRWSDRIEPQVEPGSFLELRFVDAGFIALDVRCDGEPLTRFSAQGEPDPPEIEGMYLSSLSRLSLGVHEGDDARLVVPSHRFRVRVQAPGYSTAVSDTFEADDPPERLTFELKRLPGVRGRVVADGKPVSNARVALRRFIDTGSQHVYAGYRFRMRDTDPGVTAARTDAKGEFRVEVPSSGRYALRVLADGYAAGELGPLDLVPSTGAEDLRVELVRGGAIEGMVLADGGAVAGTIVAVNDGAAHPRTQRVGPDGHFLFEGLRPGDWEVSVVEAEYDSRTSYSRYEPSDEPFPWNCEVFDGRTTHFDLDLRRGGDTTFVGTLRLGDVAAAGWTVELARERRRGVDEAPPMSGLDANGAFRLEGVTPGTYDVVLRGPEDGAGGLTITAPDQALQLGENLLELSLPTGAVRGSGAPLRRSAEELIELRGRFEAGGRSLRAVVPIVADEAGDFELPVVPAGAVELWLWAPPSDDDPYGRWTLEASGRLEAGDTKVFEL